MDNIYNQYENNIFTNFIENPKSCETLILETKHTLAFHDKFPRGKIHIQIIPRNKYRDMYDFLKKASEEEKRDFDNTIITIIEKFQLEKHGFNVKVNNHESHSQAIMHYHMHIINHHS